MTVWALFFAATAATSSAVRASSGLRAARLLPASRARVRLSTRAQVDTIPPVPISTGARLLWANELSRANDGKNFQFDKVSLQLLAGQRLGLVGPNGCGKSTLLKTIAGVERADGGLVETSRGARILYVEQEPPLRGTTIREAVYTGIEPDPSSVADTALRAAHAYHVATQNADIDPDGFMAAADAAADCWDHDARLQSICDVLGLSAILDKDVASCSGGQRKRAGLAAALARQPDALLLDEPTNHLDGRAVEWLISLLTMTASNREAPAVLVVSHDRFFLEKVCGDGILELDRGGLHRYDWRGNYGRYLELKDERLGAEKGVADRARIVLRKERDWMAKQPQARQTKSVARQDRFYKLEEKAAAGGPAGGAELTGLAGMQRTGRPFTGRTAGKTTLLRALAGQIEMMKGERIVGETVRIGYYDQRGLEGVAEQAARGGGGESGRVDPMSLRVLAFVSRCVEDARGEGLGSDGGPDLVGGGSAGEGAGGDAQAEQAARRLLNMLAFPQDKWGALVGRLSGGERRRLQLLAVLARSPNLLILDEPTNDLDLPTIAALEQFLHESFGGVLICVSHDRAFVERTCTDGVLAFMGDGLIVPMEDGYGQYIDTLKEAIESERVQGRIDRKAVSASGGKAKKAKRPKAA
ncbi:P-loop containing nucleoside triphosphate hydrolase protein [Pavlovales sp. CCMP2436]|nr:P-loop containing nucleoside triphosphate hydrolase protein [Pavlovales sp. CCMP2436]